MSDEMLENTNDAGKKAVDRTEELLSQIVTSLDNLTSGFGEMASHLSKLEVQQTAESVPHIARTAVNDGMDTVGDATGVAAKGVDVPLAISEDVIHDAGEVTHDANEQVKKTRKKLFKKRGRV